MLLLLLFRPEVVATLLFGGASWGFPIVSAAVVENGILWVLTYPWRKLQDWITKWMFLVDAPAQVQNKYNKADGAPFLVPTPGVDLTFVSSPKHLKEIDSAPQDVLSLQGAAKVLLSPEQSMHNFDWAEYKGRDGAPLIRTLRSLLRHDLPNLLPKTRVSNDSILDDVFEQSGKAPEISQLVRSAVVHTCAVAFFGEEIASNKDFIDVGTAFVGEVIVFTEIVRVLPKFAVPAATRLLKLRFNSQKTFFEYLEPLAQRRIDEQEQLRRGHRVPEHRDCIQWVMEQSSKLKPWTAEITDPWKADRIVHELMALWFGSLHAISMTVVMAVQDLCLHPEYVEPLRQELEGPAYQAFEATGKGLPLLDSFLKESARISPLDHTSTRRKALQRFEFSDGLVIEKGKFVCTPAVAMMQDPKQWMDPLVFHGFRHVSEKTFQATEGLTKFTYPEPAKASDFTDAKSWQTWGTGRNACPGRYFAAAAIKQITGLILTKYDCTTADVGAKRSFSWRSCSVPSSCMKIVLKPREKSVIV